jgi:hypothetical protein
VNRALQELQESRVKREPWETLEILDFLEDPVLLVL